MGFQGARERQIRKSSELAAQAYEIEASRQPELNRNTYKIFFANLISDSLNCSRRL
jgi:hypothetical protein